MGILDIFRGTKDIPEKRVSVSDPQYWPNFFQQFGLSKTNQNVTPDNALQSTVVYACVRVLAETVASLPCLTYKRKQGNTRDIADEHVLYFLLHDAPNPDQTAFEFWEMNMGFLALRGNAYNYKTFTMGGELQSLTPLNPNRMQVTRDREAIIYRYTHDDGKQEQIPSNFIWHIKGLSSDGLTGLSPVSLAREAIGLSIGVEDYGSRFFANDARPGGILKYPGSLTEDSRKNLKESWEAAHTGANAHRLAVLEGGLDWTQVGMSNEDSQFLELRSFQVEDVARIFRVPCFMIGHPDKVATYASAEQSMLSFVMHTIRPWLVRIEHSARHALLTPKESKKYFVEFKIDGMLRGDIKTRAEAYRIGREWGWWSANDVRRLENENPVVGGDVYLQPLNMIDASRAEEFQKKQPTGGKTDAGNNGSE